MRFRCSLFCVTIGLLLVPFLATAANVQLIQTSKTTYSITYTGFKDVGGVHVFLYYDPQTTNIQGFEQGKAVADAKGQFSDFDNRAGMANFAAITTNGFPDKDGSLLAIVNLGGVDPKITMNRVTLSSTGGRPLPSPTLQMVSNLPPSSPQQPVTPTPTSGSTSPGATTTTTTSPQSPTTPTTTSTTGSVVQSGATQVTGGSVTLPSDPLAPSTPTTPAKPEDKTIELQVLANPANTATGGEAPKKAEPKAAEIKSVVYKSILQRFIDTEQPTPAVLIGLFVDPIEPAIKQTPAIAYAGGSSLRVTVNSAILTTASPTLMLKGAKLAELGTEGDFWVVDAKTLEKVVDGKLLIQDGERTLEMPLIIVPKIKLAKDKAGKVDATEFARVLADRGNDKKAKYDFNGDGKHDAVDDYIYTANYIEQTGLTPTKPKETPKPQVAPAGEGKETKAAESKAAAPAAATEEAAAPAPKKKKKK